MKEQTQSKYVLKRVTILVKEKLSPRVITDMVRRITGVVREEIGENWEFGAAITQGYVDWLIVDCHVPMGQKRQSRLASNLWDELDYLVHPRYQEVTETNAQHEVFIEFRKDKDW